MNNFNKNLKAVLFIAFFLFSTSYIATACITVDPVTITSEIDNGDGTCTYIINIPIASSTTAATASFSLDVGAISNCDGGSCTDVAITPGSSVTATITKDCAEVVKISALGSDAGGTPCGESVLEFSGLEPLPAELVGFTFETKERVNQLSWKTASEENVLAFVIQRSTNGQNNFETIGRVESNGNSSTPQFYEFADENPVSLAYYRLQIIDNDASFEFSDVLVIERSKTEIELVEVFPVPVVENEVTVLIHASKEGHAFVDLFDMTGRLIRQNRIELKAGINSLAVDWESNEGNVYFLTIYNGRERISKKILKSTLD